jgi:hypothetical protein
LRLALSGLAASRRLVIPDPIGNPPLKRPQIPEISFSGRALLGRKAMIVSGLFAATCWSLAL